MQYKTITVSRTLYQKRKTVKRPDIVGIEYEKIINEQTAEGWKLVGIHPIETITRLGCGKLMLNICTGSFIMNEKRQTDVLIFFRDDGTEEYTGPEYTEPDKKSGEVLRKTGTAIAGAARSTVDFIKSEETANRISGLKSKAMSSLSGVSEKFRNDDSNSN